MHFSREKFLRICCHCSVVFIFLFLPLEARADEIAITSGYYSFASISIVDGPPSFAVRGFDFAGANFRAFGVGNDVGGEQVNTRCSPCLAGSSMTLTSTTILLLPVPGFLEIGDRSHPGFFNLSSLTFDNLPVVIPIGAPAELTLQTSFMMSGIVNFSAVNSDFQFNSPVFGSGLTTINLAFSQRTGQYEIRSVRYDFQSPVPEPTTLILLGTGLTGIVVRSYKHRRARRQKC